MEVRNVMNTRKASVNRHINRTLEAVRAALGTREFEERFRAAAPELLSQVEELSLSELSRRKVDLRGVRVSFTWDPAERTMGVVVEPAPAPVAKLRSVSPHAPPPQTRS